MTTFGNILSCTVGGAALQLEDHKWEEKAILRGGVRAGSSVKVTATGWLETAGGVDDTALATALRAAETSFRASRQVVQFYGAGATLLHELNPSSFVEGGPHIDFTVQPGLDDARGARRVNFTVYGETVLSPDTGKGDPVPERKTETAPDTLLTVTWSGDLSGTDVGESFSLMKEKFAAQFTPPRHWVISYEFTQTSDTGNKGKFSMSATELVDDLPEGALSAAVDGSATVTRDRDEQMRLTITFDYDLVVEGPVDELLGLIRPEGLILRETVAVGQYRKRTLKATFVTLQGGDGTALLNWQATLRYERLATTYAVKRYANVAPVLVARPPTLRQATYSGSLVGAGVFMNPPAPPDPPAAYLLEAPTLNYTRLNDVEYRTDWQYVFAVDPKLELTDLLALLNRMGGENLRDSPLPATKQKHPPLPAQA